MTFKRYFRAFYLHGAEAGYLLSAFVCGAIPAAAIFLRAELIDLAVARSGGAFFAVLAVFCGIYLANILLEALSKRLFDAHRVRQTRKLDELRVEKASRTAFSVTESERFHVLLGRAQKAPEADEKLFRALGDTVRAGTRVVLSLAVILFSDVFTALGMAVLMCVGVFLNARLARTTQGFWANYIEKMRRANYFSSLLMQKEYAAERKLFSYDREIGRRYDGAFETAKRENAKSGKKRFLAESLLEIASAVYTVAVVLLLLRPLLLNEITIGTFTSVFYAAVGLLPVTRQLYAGVFTASESARQLEGLSAFFELPEEQAKEDYTGGVPDIVFDNVTFSYPSAVTPVLEGLSLTIKAGRHYALVGENGCGKTTLVKLLLGLYTPDEGHITVGGQEVSTLSLAARRKLFAAVFQDFYEYPLTIRENVSLSAGAPVSDERIRALFESIGLHPAAAEGEGGYDTGLKYLKQGGGELSGGEWQKLAVGRCILSSAPVVVLDEPNSALDPVSEAAVYRAYRKELMDRTTLFISHRLGSVRMADEIVVLKDGKVLAAAPHGQLMERCPYYAALYNTQKEMYDERA